MSAWKAISTVPAGAPEIAQNQLVSLSLGGKKKGVVWLESHYCLDTSLSCITKKCALCI